MCKCTPEVRTPFCGKRGCEWPASPPPTGAPRVPNFYGEFKIQEFQIAKLELKPGDVLVAKLDRDPTSEEVQRVRHFLMHLAPKDVKLGLLAPGCELIIIKPPVETPG